MPKDKLSMRKIRDVLRYRHTTDLSFDGIARALNISKGVVAKYLKLADEEGLSWPLPDDLDDRALERHLLHRPAAVRESAHVEPDYARVHQELKRKGVTLTLLWEEYCADTGAAAYQYTAFCTRYRAWTGKLKRSMRQHHRAGEKLFTDYAGPTVPVIDAATGEICFASIFVAVLGASNYTYACATAGQTQADWLKGIGQALQFIGGVTELIVPDNPRALICDANRYEPELNRATAEFAAHYGTVILPARPRKPQDKAKVEVGVQVVERWILARLRHRQFFSLAELNAAIAELLLDLNARPFKKLPGCRRTAFENLDVSYLKPLPARPFIMADWKRARVNIDYHVEFDHHYYSVPHQLVRQEVELRITLGTLEVLAHGRRVASHPRSHRKGGFTTTPEHMPAAHRAHADWSPGKLLTWAVSVGTATGELVKRLLEEKTHPEQGYRSCLGLMRQARTVGHSRMEAACERALLLRAHSYKSVASILAKGLDRQPLAPSAQTELPLPNHANVRGPTYYH
jgi:transposase